MKNSLVCDRISLTVLSVATLFSIVGFIPGGFLSLGLIKGFVFCLGVLVSFSVWLLGRLIAGSFTIPRSAFFLALGIFVLAMFLSALLSSTPTLSFFGESFEQGTFAILLSSSLAVFLAASLFRTQKRILTFFAGFFLLYIMLALYQVAHLIFPNATALATFGSKVATPAGLWSDFSILSGAALVGFMLMFEFLSPSRLFKFLAILGSILALFFIMVSNSFLVWVLVGLCGLFTLIYKLVSNRLTEGRRFPVFAFTLSLIALFFIPMGGFFGGYLSQKLDLGFVNVNPTVQATSHVAWRSLKTAPLFGAGPNRFLVEWHAYHPQAVNSHTLWNVPFNFGFSFFSTVAFLGGIVGLLSVIFLVLMFIYESMRKAFMFSSDGLRPMLIFSTFLLSFYFFAVLVTTAPGISIVATTFLFVGILFAALVDGGRVSEKTIAFLNDQRASFFSILSIVILILCSVSMMYMTTERVVATIYLNKGFRAVSMGDIQKGDARFAQAASISDTPLIERTRTALAVQALNKILSSPSSSQDVTKTAVQQAISAGNIAARAAIALDPKDIMNYLNLGDLMQMLVPLKVDGALASSKDAYDRAIKLAPHYPLPYFSLAELYFNANDNKTARTYIDQALAEKPNYTEAYFLLAQIEIADGNTQTAIQRLQDATIVDPTNPDTHFELGLLRYQNGDYAGARTSLGTAVNLDNSYLNAWYFLALANDRAGNKDEAKQILEALHDRLPDNKTIQTAYDNVEAGRPAAPASITAPATTTTTTTSKTEKSKKLPVTDTKTQ